MNKERNALNSKFTIAQDIEALASIAKLLAAGQVDLDTILADEDGEKSTVGFILSGLADIVLAANIKEA